MTQRRLSSTLLALLLTWTLSAQAQIGDLPRSTAAQQGLVTDSVTAFLHALLSVPDTEIHHVMVVRNGHVVAEVHPEPFRAHDAHTLYSASKTFVSLAVGCAIDDNRLRLSDRALPFLAGHLPDTVSDRLASITVRDLLIMSSGIKPDWAMRNREDDWIAAYLRQPINGVPGETFQYDSMCSFLLSVIVQQATGRTVLDYLQEKIFGPMHVTDVDWEQSPDGYNTGGWGLRLQAESQAKLGMLMLNHGQWNGTQLVSQQWIDQAMGRYADYHPEAAPTDGNQGYGYHLWHCKQPGTFRADGALGQYIVWDPATSLVVVINGISYHGHDELACIWRHLIPGATTTTLPVANKAQQRLETACRTACLPAPSRTRKSPREAPGTLVLEKNSNGITTITAQETSLLIDYEDGHSERIALQPGKWAYTPLQGFPPYTIGARDRFKGLSHNFVVAAQAQWTAPHQWTADLKYVNWISTSTIVVDRQTATVTITPNNAAKNSETIYYTPATARENTP